MANTPLNPQALIARGKWNDYRDEIWGDSYNWSWVRPWNQLEGILIHHSVTKHEATPDDIALLHKARGWKGIGYHFVITKDGTVYYVGDISTARAHVANKNEKFLGICLIGDFTKHLPSDEQIKSAHDLVKFFLTETPSLPTLNNWNQMQGHKEQQATACPGTSWKGAGDSMYERIKNRIPYTPEPTPTPEPPATNWEEKYNQEVRDHTATKEAFKRFKEDAELVKKEAVRVALDKLNKAVDKAQEDATGSILQ